ncbi:hypothetical protein KPL71_016319 [Citrus sinensis]|uniref:Uncharacterized protein n=1 Tax=Citrus sinensis TaxID=2711 RepID=A0ACB8KS35_CITSI|nr:hypothetical protein KPL71_016319 [Citrus sinensis]
MDSPYVHQSRYVTISSSPPPSNPNLYRPQIYLAPPPPHRPPPPHPPPQQQLLPPPPPPQQLYHHCQPPPTVPPPVQKVSFNSHHSQFQFSPNFSPNPKPQNQYHHHQRSNDFAHRISINDDRLQQHQQTDRRHHHHRQHPVADFEARQDVWDRHPRIQPDHRPVVSSLDRHHEFDHRPLSPYRSMDKIKHELDTTSYRFRERYSNDVVQFEHTSSNNSNQRVDFVSHRSQFVSTSDRLNSSNYDNQHGSQFDSNELMSNNVRDVGLNRPVFKERESRDSLLGRGSNSENSGDGVRAFSGKREFYASDAGRYGNNRGSREHSYEYNRTPRKQVQKKSALLRIQKPYYRNRDDGELHHLNYEIKSGSFRGKDQVVFSDRDVGEHEQREGSPVELDVSFKSNSLVAKAIVATSSSVSDTNLTPKKGNTRKIVMSNKDHSSLQMNKPLDSSRKLGGSRDAVNNALVSEDKDSKQAEKKVAPSCANKCDTNSNPCSSGSNTSPAKITVEKLKSIVPEKCGTTKTSALKVAKKKKVAKRVVKKAINPTVHVSGSQPTEKLDELLKADASTLGAPAASVLKMGVKPSKDKISSAAMASGHLDDLQAYTYEANMSPGTEQVGGSPETAMVSKEVSTDGDSCAPCVTKIKRKRSGSISRLACSSHKETKIDEGSVNADGCLHVLNTASNFDKDLTKLLNETNFSDIGGLEGADKHFCHNGHSLLHENSETKEYSEPLLREGRNINSDLKSLEEIRRHEVHVNTCSSAHGMNTTTSCNIGLLSSQEKMTDSEVGILNASSKQPCKGQMSSSVNSSTVEGFPSVMLPGRCEISAFSSSEETDFHNASTHVDRSNGDKGSCSGSDRVIINSEEINPGTGDYNGRQLATNEVTIAIEGGHAGGLANTMFSVGSREDGMSNNTDKCKVMTSVSDLPDAMVSDMDTGPVKAFSSVQSLNTALSVKDSFPVEVRVTEGLDVGLQSSSDGLSVFRGHNSTGGCCEANVSESSGLNGSSPENRKRRKVSANHPGFTSEIVPQISEGPVTPDLSTSGVELPSNSTEGQMHPEEGVAVSNMDTLCDSSLPPCPDGITVLLDSGSAQISSEVAVSVHTNASGFGDDSLKVEPRIVEPSLAFGESDNANVRTTCPPGSEGKQIVNEDPVVDGTNYNNEDMCTEKSKMENIEAFVVEEQVKACNVTTEFETPEHQSSDLNKILPATDVESDCCLLERGDLSRAYRALVADGDGVSTTNSYDEMMEFDSISELGSPEILSTVPVMNALNHEASASQISNEKVCRIEKIPSEEPVDEGFFNLSAHTSPSEHAKINLKLDDMLESAHLVAQRTVSLPAQDVKDTGLTLNPMSGETNGKKHQASHCVSRIHPRRSSSVFTASRDLASSTRTTCTTRPRTWHRTESSSASPAPGNKSLLPPQNQLPKKVAKFQSMSYIRKGNSLVRKPAPVAAVSQVSHGLTSSVYWLNSSGIGESKKTRGSEGGADVVDPTSFLRGVNAPLERPRTPPLPVVAKVPNHATSSTGDYTSSPVAEPLPNGCSETKSDTQKLMEINDELNFSNAALNISKTPVNQTGSVNGLESQGELNDGTLCTSNVKRITYLKRKSNQLIAASNGCSLSVQNPDKTQSTASDGYYKRRKNQLIRTPLESQINQTVSLADGSFTSEGEKCAKDIFTRSDMSQSYKVEKKRQENGAESFASETKIRIRSCRERIFRIGSVRYKMDSSRRTLQRISDDSSPCAAGPTLEKNAKKSYIPRRLVIGNDEYVRIGNGNQLIRDPKRRARVLASEKVRWSLHTARLRLARKRKYCQFFTRFGKCNKDNGKCPYIHDPSKIAVCTKFLKGLCSNSDCKLTHKVIPERMPDCSYFLQGLCTNKNCPYRHVHVNPNASTCEGFLKGYCADGDECRKKHSYVCPTFKATGSCALGAKCRLHHPKSRSNGKKSRRSRKPKNTHGRYFGSMLVEDSESQTAMSERPTVQNNGNLFVEGKLVDYIGLDVSDKEAGETNDALHELLDFNDSGASELQLDDLDELIKPIRIMNSHPSSYSTG